MENILTLNQSIFGTKTKERRSSRRALKASVQELYVPQESDVITYDEGYDIDGGAFYSSKTISVYGESAAKQLWLLATEILGQGVAATLSVGGIVGGCALIAASGGLLTVIGAVRAFIGFFGLACSLTAIMTNGIALAMGIYYYCKDNGFKLKKESLFWGKLKYNIVSGL